MIISDLAVKKSISVLVLAALILVMGTYSYLTLPREAEPDVSIPHVFISTAYRGVAPGDIESSITIEIENKLKSLDGVKNVKSVSSEGESLIDVEFSTGVDIDDALRKVKDKVDEAKGELPTDLEDDPYVFEVNISEMPILIFSLAGTCGQRCLKEIADTLEDEIEGVPGVLDVEITGAREREIRVEFYPEKLAYYGLSIPAVQAAVQGENSNTSGGALHMGDGKFQVRIPGEFTTPEELYDLVIGTHDGQPVYARNVAQVLDSFKEETSRSRLNGLPAVNIVVKKRSGENIIAIADAVEEILAKRQPGWPTGTTITKVLDKAKDTKSLVADLENNILSGLVLVVVVIFFAMGIRNALLVSMAIPFSMLLSFMILQALGITLNMVVLFSLILALGMLVDNAIVIIENIYRFMEQGVPRTEAAMKATSEVAMPVIGSTLTTLAVFSPMLFWPGIMGEFMGYLPLTLIITLSSSLFVALVINPALASLFMKSAKQVGSVSSAEVEASGEQPVVIRGPLLRPYAGLLRFCLNHPLALIAAAVFLLIFMFQGWLLVVGIEKPVEFFPDLEPKGIYVNTDMPEGADLNYIDSILRQIEEAVTGTRKGSSESSASPSDLNNVKIIYSRAVSSTGGGSAFEPNTPNHVGVRFLDLTDRSRSSYETVEEIRTRIKDIAGAKITVAMEAEGPPTGAPINIELSGDNFTVLGSLAKEIRAALEKIPHVEDIQDNYVEGMPSIRIRIDRQKAALFGLNTSAIGSAIKTSYNGLAISSFREGNEDYDITVQLPEKDRQVDNVLREFMIPTPTGVIVPLSTLATVDYTGSLGNINRINNLRTVTVKANVDETKIPGPVVREQAEKLLAQMHLPPGYTVRFTGENQEQQESQAFLSRAFVIALFFIFLILVTQFNSVSQPFIIMSSVILSMGGAFFGLMLYRQPFGIIMTGIGVISLAGVVVNNAIVLIDYTNKLRASGLALLEAVISAGATRLRPVLLTAITTVLGLIPMVTGVSYDFRNLHISWVSESSQWWQSMAIVVIFGLLVATFLTLVVVPVLYFLIERSKEIFVAGREEVTQQRIKLYRVLAGEKERIHHLDGR
ncbi:MAG: efflux RND transporter permease subunit [Candidatus Electrothrix sp. GW3-4]|uniref:efflux RND transporter permease subunit n=1 Tax=Candidatus Electrothrix sp. GW3-4 TaxID=3126740 RepID=UPI0030CB8AE4